MSVAGPVVAVAARAYPGETVSGDACAVQRDGETLRLALVDGVGHGAGAAEVAGLVLATLDQDRQCDPVAALSICHRALVGTRGAVMTVANIDAAGELVIAGVGNVDAYLVMGTGGHHFVPRRGVLGVTLPRLVAERCQLTPPWTLVLHSDGIRARFSLDDPLLETARAAGAAALASLILEDFARADDDATVAVVMGMVV